MRKYNIIKRIFCITFIFAFILQVKSFGANLEDVIRNVEYTSEYTKWLNLSEEEQKQTIMPRMYEIESFDNTNYNARNVNLKSSLISSKLMISNKNNYDLRDYITIKVRDQGSTGQCWAISTNSAIESNIEKTTGKISPLFSSRYTEYATSRTFLDGVNSNSFNREAGGGGFAEIALGLYTSGRGPVLEDDMPFENNENKINFSKIENLKTQKQIKDYVRFPGIYKTYSNGRVIYMDASNNIYTENQVKEIRNKIKEHIIKYGGVVSQTYGVGGATGLARQYYNNTEQVMKSTAYFCNKPSVIADHQITIIGWDDDYDISNFNPNCRPTTKGAYIVLNSWGENFGENGVYYISYEDAFIERLILGIISTEDLDYDNIYQYDELGNNYVIAVSGEIYGANVFERNDSSKDELLTQISLSCLVDTKCDVYVNAEDGELNSTKLKKVASNLELKDGYHTINLEKPIKLTGDKFVIALKYITDKKGTSYMALEYPDKNYWATATAEKGQSYLSMDFENWEDMMELSGTTIIPQNSNLCIKAFTIEEENTQTDKFFRVANYKVDEEYIYNISPNTNFNEFTNNISTNMEYYVYDKENNILSDENIISTGMKLKVEDKFYKMVVKGDLNGDGKITITDVVKAKLHSVGIRILGDEVLKSADVNGDGKVSITDVVIINLASVNLREL